MDYDQVAHIIDRAGVVLVLVTFIYLQYAGKLIWSRDCDDTKKERDALRTAMEMINKRNSDRLEVLEKERDGRLKGE